MGPVMDRLQPFDGHVRVKLGGSERSVTKQFLDATKVRSTVEQVRRSRVTETVRPHDGRIRHRT